MEEKQQDFPDYQPMDATAFIIAMGGTPNTKNEEPDSEQASLCEIDSMEMTLDIHKIRNGHSLNCHYAIWHKNVSPELGYSITDTVDTLKQKLTQNGITFNQNYQFRLPNGSIYSGNSSEDNFSLLIHSRMFKSSRCYYFVLDYT